MWSCVKVCVMLCYFKKAAWMEEIEPSLKKKNKKPLPFNGRKGQAISHTTHLLCNEGYDVFLLQIYSQCGLV